MPTYIRLTDYKSSDEKEQGFFKPENRYEAKQEDFEKIPGTPIAYWVSESLANTFVQNSVSDIADTRLGMATADNDKFLRLWYETSINNIGFNYSNREDAKDSELKWFPYQKGGDYRKWYGNYEYIVNWQFDGNEIQSFVNPDTGKVRSHNYNLDYIFKKGITWNALSSGSTSMRVSEHSLFDNAGSSMFLNDEHQLIYCLSILNTKIIPLVINAISPTLNYQPGDIAKVPIIFPKSADTKQKIDQLTQQNIDISKEEWDSRETSWDFRTNELIRMKNEKLKMKHCKIEDAYNAYCDYWREKFFQLHANEKELNRLFIDIYELQDELTPDVPLEDITILKNEAKIIDGELVFQADEVMKQLLSYGVGVMLGRYSLDHEGLHIADMGVRLEEANEKFGITLPTYEADDDNIIPVVDEADYFADDMTERFESFVAAAFGREYLHENIAFIENAIGKKLRKYFVKDFYKDHIKRYKKRPIYWMFASPKGRFQTLIYMHRYTPDTLNQILNDYLRPFRVRLESMHNDLMRISESVDTSTTERNLAERKMEKIVQTLDDINAYEKVLAHYAAQRIPIDLDDGVKVNYCKFKEVAVPFDKKMCK